MYNDDLAETEEYNLIDDVADDIQVDQNLDDILADNGNLSKNLVSRVESFLVNEIGLTKGEKIVLAVSGGVDSVAMLDVMHKISGRYDYKLIIAHYNHGLRGRKSNEDEKFVKELAEKYKLPYHTSKGKVKQYAKKKSYSIELAARNLRYIFLERIARTFGSSIVATAHNLNDTVESFLLNLMRGTGITGLSGIPPIRSLGKNVTLIRPVIMFKKEEMKSYAMENKLAWREDESNSLLNFTRNRIRKKLIPQIETDFNPAFADVIYRTANLFRGADEFISEYVRSQLDLVVCDKSFNRFSLRIPLFLTYSDFIQGEIIQSSMAKHFQVQGINLKSVDKVISLVNSTVGSILELNAQIRVIRDRQDLIFIRKSHESQLNIEINKVGEYKTPNFSLKLREIPRNKAKFNENVLIEYLDMDLVPSKLILRNWAPGDSFTPLGSKGKMKISDFLINEKVSLADKSSIYVLATKTDIIWVCGMRLSDKYKITDSTSHVLKAEIKMHNKEAPRDEQQ